MNDLAALIVASRSGRAVREIADASGSWTTSEWAREVDRAGERLRAAFPDTGAVVAVSLPLGRPLLAYLAAAVVADHTLCLLDSAGPAARREEVIDAVDADIIVDADGVRRRERRRRMEPLAPGYVAMSSGSTGGPPKGVISRWDAVARFALAGAEALQLGPDDTWAEVIHPTYDLPMTNLLVALASGCSLHVSGGLGDRMRLLGFTDRVGATHVRVAPRFVDLAGAEVAGGRRASVRVWGSGGDRLRTSAVERLFAAGVPTVVNTFGTSETLGFASVCAIASGGDIPAVDGNVSIGPGVVGPWQVDVVEPGPEGAMLRIRSRFLPLGYAFGSGGDYPRWTPDGVVTGDLGVHQSGLYFCLGRAGRRVKRRGQFIDLDAIDARLQAVLRTAVVTVMTPDGELVGVLEGTAEEARACRGAVASELTAETLPERFVAVRSLPRLGNGKLDLAAILASARIGEEAPVRVQPL